MQTQSPSASGSNKKSGLGGPPPANIISYKSDRLQLPEYDYNMTPAEIIRYSNQNFDYERYIRDWVAPYSNSGFYIRRFADDSQIRPYSTTTIDGSSIGNNTSYGTIYQDSQPDYSNYYKSVGNITTVNVTKPNSDNDRQLAKRPSNSTLEYLDLSDRNSQGLIGESNNSNLSYGKLKKEPSYNTTPPGAQAYDFYGSPVDPSFDVASYLASLDKQTASARKNEKPTDLYVNVNIVPDIRVIGSGPHSLSSQNTPKYNNNKIYSEQPTLTVGSVIAQPHVAQAQKPVKTTTITSSSGPVATDDKNKILAYLDTLELKEEQQKPHQHYKQQQPTQVLPHQQYQQLNPSQSQQSQSQSQPSSQSTSHFRKPDSRRYIEVNPSANDNFNGTKTVYVDAPQTVINSHHHSQPQDLSYQPQVLPPTLTYVNPSGNLVKYETIILDVPDPRILDPPSSTNSIGAPVIEYRVNKV